MRCQDKARIFPRESHRRDDELNLCAPESCERNFAALNAEYTCAGPVVQPQQIERPATPASNLVKRGRSLPARLLHAANAQQIGKQTDDPIRFLRKRGCRMLLT